MDVELSEEETSCLRKWMGEIDAAGVIAAVAAEDTSALGEVLRGQVNCVPDVFLAGLAEGMGLEPEDLGEDEKSCLREWVTGIDWGALAAAGDDPAGYATFLPGVVNCVPDVFLSEMLADTGVELEELSGDERSCLREWVTDLDWDALAAAEADAAAEFGQFFGVFACAPDLFLSQMVAEMGVELEELSEDERSCLRNWVTDLDWAALAVAGADDAVALGQLFGAFACLPERLTATEDEVEGDDDHANSVEGASTLTVGEAVQGAVDYEGDNDFFVFQAEEGKLYEINVALGTLVDSIVVLYDADGRLLASNDDHGDSLAARIVWEAPVSGDYYVEAGGYGTGSYTLTVAVSDIVDDHTNYHLSHPAKASSTLVQEYVLLTVGDAVEGALDYDGDVDFLVFEAAEGKSYEIEMTAHTLFGYSVTLYDSGGELVNFGTSTGSLLPTTLSLDADRTGSYYVEVTDYSSGTGTYTLTFVLETPTATPITEEITLNTVAPSPRAMVYAHWGWDPTLSFDEIEVTVDIHNDILYRGNNGLYLIGCTAFAIGDNGAYFGLQTDVNTGPQGGWRSIGKGGIFWELYT